MMLTTDVTTSDHTDTMKRSTKPESASDSIHRFHIHGNPGCLATEDIDNLVASARDWCICL